MSARHTALIIEDDPAIAECLKDLVASMAHGWRHAITLQDVEREIAAGGFCYALLDMQIPARPGAAPHVGCGETALGLLRASEPRRTAKGKHVLPILIVTAYSSDPSYVSKMLTEMDADDFIAKPLGPRLDLVLDHIRARLARAERAEHAACLAPRDVPASPRGVSFSEPSPPAPTGVLRMVIDGTRGDRKTVVTLDGERRGLQDSLLPVLVSLISLQKSSPGAWCAKGKLGMSRKRYAPYRIRRTFEGVVPEGFDLVESSTAGEFRLNPSVVVERVNWQALTEHPELEVQKVAREFVRRGM